MGDKEALSRPGLICHFRAPHLLTLQNSRRIWQEVFSECSLWMHKGQSQVGQQLVWRAFRVRNHISVFSLCVPRPSCPPPLATPRGDSHGQKQQASPSPQAGSLVQRAHTWRDLPCWRLTPSPVLAFSHIWRGPGPIHPCRNPHSPPNTSHLMFRGSHASSLSIMAAEASSSLLHHLRCATPPAWPLGRVRGGTGSEAKRDPGVEAERGRSLLPGQRALSGVSNGPHPGITGPQPENVPEDSRCLSAIGVTPRIPVAKLAPINLSRRECWIKGDTPQISTSLTDNRPVWSHRAKLLFLAVSHYSSIGLVFLQKIIYN